MLAAMQVVHTSAEIEDSVAQQGVSSIEAYAEGAPHSVHLHTKREYGLVTTQEHKVVTMANGPQRT